jgi:hypothetical protein
VRSLILALMCGAALTVAVSAPATADGAKCNRWTRSCNVTSEADGTGSGTRTSTTPSPTRKPDRQDAENQRVREATKKLAAAFAVYDRQLARYNRCLVIFDPSLNSAGCGSAPTLPTVPRFGSDSFSGRGNPPIRITAGQAAAIAVARLQLPTIAPGIGPAPDVNPWSMAAVGYPLWLWADGPTHVRVRSKHENCHGESRHLRQDLV